ncbi:MAG: tetratricopeptide repeat protein [Epsilonproteobacteria bacterium]|nr:tetratricopeptide repeat protein [Campylobacterota bacterium]
MKKLYQILLLILFATAIQPLQPLHAKPNANEKLFSQANGLYKKGDYDSAYQLYAKISPKNAKVNYNMGNCEYKRGNYGAALAFWRRAEKEWGVFGREELLHNIDFLKKVIAHNKSDLEHETCDGQALHGHDSFLGSMTSSARSLLRSMPLFSLQVAFLFFWLLFLAALHFLQRRRKFVLSTCCLFLAASGALVGLKYGIDYKQQGIVVIKKGNLLSGPGDNFHVIGSLCEAQEVVIDGISDEFYKVKINNQTGWIAQKNVILI